MDVFYLLDTGANMVLFRTMYIGAGSENRICFFYPSTVLCIFSYTYILIYKMYMHIGMKERVHNE